MNKVFYKKIVMLLACLLCMTFSVLADETITLKWGVSDVVPCEFTAVIGGGGTLNVYWGDGETSSTMSHQYSTIAMDPDSVVTIIASGGYFTSFNCASKNVTQLNVGGAPMLESLYCGSNPLLTALDVSSNTGLTHLYCTQGQLGTLNLNSNLEELRCHHNKLTALDVSSNLGLTYLDCSFNELSVLDVDLNTALTHLDCSVNELSTLNVSENVNLTYLDCSSNELETLDVSSNLDLTYLGCRVNKLEGKLDLHLHTALEELYCDSNTDQFDLNIDDLQLKTIWCYDNGIPLITLYDASEMIPATGSKVLGTQNLPTVIVAVGGEPEIIVAESYMEHAEKSMIHDVYLSNNTLAPYTHYTKYTSANGYETGIVFNQPAENNEYYIKVTNEAIKSQSSYPAEVYMHYKVVPGWNIHAHYEGCGSMSFTYENRESLVPGDEVSGDTTVRVRQNDGIAFFNFAPCSDCYQVDSVLVDGVNEGGDIERWAFTDIEGNHEIIVYFGKIPYTVTVCSSMIGGSISPSREVKVDCGDDKTFTITPDSCYQIDVVTVDGAPLASPVTTYTFEEVDGNHSICATFKKVPYTIEVEPGCFTFVGDTAVNCGEDITFTLDPAECFTVTHIVLDNDTIPFAGDGTYTITDVRDNHYLSCVAAKIPFTITASVCGGSGTIAPSGQVKVECGDDQTFTFTPTAPCSRIDSIFVDGEYAGSGSTYAFEGVAGNHTICVKFATIQYTITATSDGCTLTPNGQVKVNCGENQTFNFTPTDPCYKVDSVWVNGTYNATASTNGTYTFTNVMADRTIHVKCVRKTYTVTASGCFTESEPVTVLCGDDVTFTLDTDTCYQVTGIRLDGNLVPEADYAQGTYTITNVQGDHALTCDVDRIPFTITATVCGGAGTIAPSGTAGAVTVYCGTNQTFTFTPTAPCSRIDSVFVDGDYVGSSSTYTFTDVRDDHTICVKFATIKYTIGATTDGCSLEPLGQVSVDCGENQTFYFEPDGDCYQIDSVWIDGTYNATAVANGEYTFTNILDDHTIHVKCAKIPYTITATVCGGPGTISPSGEITVECGENQQFTFASGGDCYSVDSVFVDGAYVGSSSTYTFQNVTDDHTICVKYAVIPVPITVTKSGEGSVAPSGGQDGIVEVDCGEDQMFVFRPGECYKIESIWVNGNSTPCDSIVNGIGYYTFHNVTTAQTLFVPFVKLPYTITTEVRSGEGLTGTITPYPSWELECGGYKQFVFTPNPPCYKLDSILIVDLTDDSVRILDLDTELDSLVNGIGYYSFYNVDRDYHIIADYVLTQRYIKATAGANGGISASNPAGTIENDTIWVDCGINQTFSFTPDPCYRVASVMVDGLPADPTTSYTFNNVIENHTIHVTFEIIPYTIVAGSGPNGTISPSGTINNIECGDNLTFTFTPNYCYEIDVLSVDFFPRTPDSIVDGTGYYTFSNIQANHNIYVTFKQIQYTIEATVCANGHGIIEPDGDVLVNCGDPRTFTFTPDTCYHISGVWVDGFYNLRAVRQGHYTFNNVTANHEIEVCFELNTYPIGIFAGPHGSITPSGTPVLGGGILWVDCAADQTFTIEADDCYEISYVMIDGLDNDPIAVATGTYTFEDVREPHSIIALFSRIEYTITATAGPGGTISPSGDVTVYACDDQTFTITPEFCMVIATLKIDGVEVEPTTSYTFTNVSANHTIEVTFIDAEDAFIEVYSKPVPGGKVYPNGWIFPKCGADTTFLILPNLGYKINQVYVDGVHIPQAVIDGYYTFHNVVGRHTLIVDFVFIGDDCDEPLFITSSTGTVGGSIFPTGSAPLPCYSDKPYLIIPDAGYKIKEVLIDGINDPTAVASGEYVFYNITVSHNIVAKFERIGYAITSSANAGGTISPLGVEIVAQGASKTYTITSQTGYKINEVLIDDINNPTAVSSGKYTFTNVDDDHTIEVIFEQRAFTITATTTSTNGTIDPNGVISVLYGDDQLIEFYPNPGYMVSKVMVNGKSNTMAVVNGFYEFTNITANQTIEVSFAPVAPAPPAPPAPLGIEGSEMPEAMVFPNPTTGELKVVKEGLEINTVLIFDMTGRLMQEIKNINNTEVNVDMSTYTEGIYFFNVDGQNIKVVKQ